ncbi:MAG: hypothetical protein CMM47_07470 [Rhodospirillaceae bacterium]|nr:hypothetical protein [Rhodospirillaceae bacterium]
MASKFDRSAESLGNILIMEHVNLLIPDQAPATLFYVVGLQLTRDPYLMVGLDNMWINVGRSQVHLPRRDTAPQVLRGTVGIVVPNLDEVEDTLTSIAYRLEDTKFRFKRNKTSIDAVCPWGNKFRIHGPGKEFGEIQIGVAYVELNAPPGSADGIARFYREILEANAKITKRRGKPCASVTTGASQFLYFIETKDTQPDYDGHHVAIYIADFEGPYQKLLKRGLITMESDAYEWRFIDIVDPKSNSNKVLFQIEHEVRSATHPLYGRPLVNRNPAQSNRPYRRGQDHYLGRI